MDYSTIRQLNMFLFFLLFCALYTLIKERLGFGAANFFVIAMMSGFAILIPVSMQFFSVFAVSFIASIAVLYLEKQDRRQFGFLFYFVTGSVTSFLDLLTAPLFTLCLPLVLSVLLEIREKRVNGLKGQFIKVITCSIGWGFGFGLTWMFKWLYSSVLLGRNVFMEAFNAMVLRTGGGFEVREDFSNSLVVTWGANIMRLCTPVVLAALIAAFVIWLAAFCFYKKPWGQLKELLAVLFIAAYPYFWYAVLSYHSQGHGWFTYRVQLASIFAVLCAMLYSIDLQRVKHKLFKVGKAGD